LLDVKGGIATLLSAVNDDSQEDQFYIPMLKDDKGNTPLDYALKLDNIVSE
jgi:hypothetical protein